MNEVKLAIGAQHLYSHRHDNQSVVRCKNTRACIQLKTSVLIDPRTAWVTCAGRVVADPRVQ